MAVTDVCASTLGNVGYIAGEAARTSAADTASLIRQAAAALIAIDNANQLVDNYRKQRNIQDRMLLIQEQQQQHLETVFWPREAQFLNEFTVAEPVEAVETMGRRYAGRLVATVAGGFAQKLREARCNASRYCSSAATKNLQDLLMARSAAMANARVLGRNIAFAEYQARTDRNVERRMQAIAMGRGLMQQAANLYAAAGQGLAAAGGILSGQMNKALEAFGYARNFREDLRQQAYESAEDAQNVQAPRQGATAPGPASSPDGRPLGTALQETFGFDSSARSMFSPQAADVFKNPERDIIDQTETLFADQMRDGTNIGFIGGG